jgi:hypothetical protein
MQVDSDTSQANAMLSSPGLRRRDGGVAIKEEDGRPPVRGASVRCLVEPAAHTELVRGFGQHTRELREVAGPTADELDGRCGTVIYKIESWRPGSRLVRVCYGLNRTTDDLRGDLIGASRLDRHGKSWWLGVSAWASASMTVESRGERVVCRASGVALRPQWGRLSDG